MRFYFSPLCLLLLVAGCQPNEEISTSPPDSNVSPNATAVLVQPVGTNSADPGFASGSDWPQWRGPRGDGISVETGWKTAFDQLPSLWQAEIGTGYSSLSISAGRLYSMGHVGEEDVVHCFDAKTGKKIWEHKYPCDLVDNLHDGGPACTPTVHDGKVYTVSKLGHFFCLNAESGEVIWARRFADDLGVPRPEWGFSCSPTVWNDLVYVDGGRIAAYDRKLGEVVWKSKPYAPGYGSVAKMSLGSQQLVAVLNNEGLFVLDALSGSEIDQKKWETSYKTSATTPLIHEDTIFFSTGYNQGCALFKLNGGKLEYVYDNRSMSNHMNNCVLWEGHLYGIDGNSHQARNCTLTCMEHATGEVKWTHRGLGCGSVLIAGGKLIVLSDAGQLAVAPVSTKAFEPTGTAEILGGTCWTVPVLSHGLLYARNSTGALVCVDLRK